MGTNFLAGPVA